MASQGDSFLCSMINEHSEEVDFMWEVDQGIWMRPEYGCSGMSTFRDSSE